MLAFVAIRDKMMFDCFWIWFLFSLLDEDEDEDADDVDDDDDDAVDDGRC